MKLTKEEMIQSLKDHLSTNKFPNWPPDLVKELLEVVKNYKHDSYETLIPLVPLKPPSKRPSRELRNGVFQRGF